MHKKVVLFLVLFSFIALSVSVAKEEEPVKRFSDKELKKAHGSARRSAQKLLAKLSTREKLGQMLMLDIRTWRAEGQKIFAPITRLNPELKNIFEKYALGSVILFRENLRDSKQIVKLVNTLQSTSESVPLFIAVDQEGGYVTRLQDGTDFPGNMALAATRNPEFAKKVGQAHGLELSALGININFAPVVDINSNQNNPVIAIRSYSDNLGLVSKMADAYISGLSKHPVMATVKHFPGHGNVAMDSHYGLPSIDITEKEWRRNDFKPFLTSIKKGVDAVMTAHIAIPALDNEKMRAHNGTMIDPPATLSKRMLTGILREELKFKGLIFTDALDMGAITNFFTPAQAAIHTIMAGSDVLTMPIIVNMPSDLPRFASFFRTLEKRMETDEAFAARVDESVERILYYKFKMKIGWKQADLSSADEVVASEEHRKLEDHIAEKSITMLENDKILPYRLKENQTILILNHTEARNELIRDEIRNIISKMKKTSVNVIAYKTNYMPKLSRVLKHSIEESNLILMCTENLSSKPPLAQAIIDYANEHNKKIVVVATRNPYDIVYLDNVHAYLAIYGIMGYDRTNNSRNRLEANMRAAIRTIFYHPRYSQFFSKPTGKLPVNIMSHKGDKKIYPYGYGLRY